MSNDLNNLLENLKEDPSPSTYYAVVEFYRKDKDYENAIKYADECLSEFPNNLKVSLAKGKILIDEEKLDPAREVFETIVEKRATHYMANQQLAKIYKMQSEFDKALEHLNVLLDENPDDDLINEEIKEIKEIVAKGGESSESDAEIYTISNAKVYEEKGETDKAKEIYTKILGDDPENSEAKEALEKLSPTEVPEESASSVEDKFTDLFEEGEIEEPENEESEEGMEEFFSEENKEADEFEDIFDEGKSSEEESSKAEETFSNIFEEENQDEKTAADSAGTSDEILGEDSETVAEVSDDFGDIFSDAEEEKESGPDELEDIFGEDEKKEEEVKEEEDVFDSDEVKEEEKEEPSDMENIFGEDEEKEEEAEEIKEEIPESEEEKEDIEEIQEEKNGITTEHAEHSEIKEEEKSKTEEGNVFEEEDLEETPSEFTEEEESDDTLKQMLQGELDDDEKEIFEEGTNEKTEIASEVKEETNENAEIESVFDQAFGESEAAAEDETMDMFAAADSEENNNEEDDPGEETVIYSTEMKPGETLEEGEEKEEEIGEEEIEEVPEQEKEEEPEAIEEEISEKVIAEEPQEEVEEEIVEEELIPAIEQKEVSLATPLIQGVPVYLANKVQKPITSIDEFLNYIWEFEGIDGVYIVSTDGLLISGKPEEPNFDINEFSADVAEILKKQENLSILIGNEQLNEMEIGFEKGKLFAYRVNVGFIFVQGKSFVLGSSLMPIIKYLVSKVEKDGIL
ncbi:roadblock/LC7 domain-containing protein [bacterium]|nr:roadblock/LC7 domain-containing protein [bacterium]